MKTIEDVKSELISQFGKENEDIIRAVSNTVFEFAQRWIPVSEELPEMYAQVLVQTNEGIKLSFRDTYQNGEMKWFLIRHTLEVTHWRPINFK